MSANIREILIGFGKGKQTDIATANLVASIWQLKKLNAALANPKLNTESDGSLAKATSLRRRFSRPPGTSRARSRST